MSHPEKFFEKVKSSVFEILTPSGSGGTGFLARPDGLIITNAHVVMPDRAVKIRDCHGNEEICRVIKSDRNRDLAAVHFAPKANSQQCQPLPLLAKSRKLNAGQDVFTIGCPGGCSSLSFVGGYISATSFQPDHNQLPFVQLNLSVNPGNSGGPVLLQSGEVVAVMAHYRLASDGQRIEGLSFGIPSGDVQQFMDSIPDLPKNSGEFQYCVVCGDFVKPDKYCSHCGVPLETGDPKISLGTIEGQCPTCGNLASADGKYCDSCGSSLSEN